LLTALLGEDEAFESLKRVLIERTEGNPFFLEETVRTLVKTKVLVGNRGAYRMTKAPETWQIPATVQASLAARIDRLPPQDKRLLQAASVIGKDVPFRLLQAIADVGVSGAAAVALKCWTCRSQVALARVGPLRSGGPNTASWRAVLGDLAQLAQAFDGLAHARVRPGRHTPRPAAYDLRKLHGKALVRRVGMTHRYQPQTPAIRTLAALLILRGAGKPKPGRPPKKIHPLDVHYENLHREMRRTFETLGLAV
jgi:hypothetical protein